MEKVFENGYNNKRYYTLDYYYKKKYNSKVFKVSLNQNVTCPNIDGTKGYGGCIFCKNGSKANDIKKDLKHQFEEVRDIILNKWPSSKYIAYFQSNTNTYAPVEYLKKNFEEVLTYDNVIGINIATRCDAISDECLKYLSDLNKRTDLVIELGLQTINEKTSLLINRGHTLKEFEDCINKLKKNNINFVIHIINGLPYETKEDMINTIKYVNKLKPLGVKIHMMHILRGTKLEKLYEKEHFHVLTKDEYIDIVCDQLEFLNKDIVINRITGDPIKEDLIEPTWLIRKFCVLNDIDKELVKRNSYQGIKEE